MKAAVELGRTGTVRSANLALQPLQTACCVLNTIRVYHRVTKLPPQDRPDKTQQLIIRTCVNNILIPQLPYLFYAGHF